MEIVCTVHNLLYESDPFLSNKIKTVVNHDKKSTKSLFQQCYLKMHAIYDLLIYDLHLFTHLLTQIITKPGANAQEIFIIDTSPLLSYLRSSLQNNNKPSPLVIFWLELRHARLTVPRLGKAIGPQAAYELSIPNLFISHYLTFLRMLVYIHLQIFPVSSVFSYARTCFLGIEKNPQDKESANVLQPSRNFERLQGNPIPNSSRASPNYMKKTKQAILSYKATKGGFAPL